VKHFFSFK